MTDTNPASQTSTLDPMAFQTAKSGKTVADFTIPVKLHEDPDMINLIMGSEALDDSERQYWFNLTDVMNEDQKSKLRDILVREKKKLAEIYQKYGKKQPINPKEAARQAELAARQRQQHQAALKEKEAAHEKTEAQSEDELFDDSIWGA